jgi:ABC-2 type transport system ATP-binding protein
MLHEPEFLLLDEPTLGLDPNGVVETRDILRDMRSQGATLFFSSHQLAEMEKVCDRVAFMKDGRLIASGAPADLLPSMDGDRVLQVEIHEDAGPTLDAVRDLEAVAEADQIGAHHIRVRLKSGGEDAREARATLSRDFAHLGLTVLSVAATTPTLEDLFLAFAAPSPTKH